MSGCGCGCLELGRVGNLDARAVHARAELERHPGVMGPGLGGGVVPRNVAAGVGRVGGGVQSAVVGVIVPTEVAVPAKQPQRFAFDFSTVTQRDDVPAEPALGRAFGGLR